MTSKPSTTTGRRLCRTAFCSKDITNLIHISCAACDDFDLCLHCFSCGVEQDDHVNNHPYRVIDNMKFELFDTSWGADDELRLLDAIEKFGIGNWSEIGEIVGKGADEVERHYIECYIKSKTAPIPVLPTPGTKIKEVKKDPPKFDKLQYLLPAKETNVDSAPLGFSTFAGYYPKRDDYEQEHNNASEALIAGIVFYDDDTLLDKKLKTAMLRIYNRKLNERQIHKEFCLKYDIVGNSHMIECFQNQEFRSILERYQAFARLQTPAEFKQFVEALYAKFQLTKKVAHYQECRKAGISRVKDIPKYEMAKKRQFAIASKDGGRRGSSTNVGRPRAGSASGGPRKGATASQSAVLYSGLPSSGLLAPDEMKMCQGCGLLPSQFLRLKAGFIREDQRCCGLTWTTAQRISGFNDYKTSKVYLLMDSKGWIKAKDKPFVQMIERELTLKTKTNSTSATPVVTNNLLATHQPSTSSSSSTSTASSR